MDEQSEQRRSAFIPVVGRPSSGKSTLINALCEHKVSIVSPIPQTTRNAIRGIINDPRGQLVLVDTPGMHDSTRAFNLRMQEVVNQQKTDADAVLYALDAARAPAQEEALVLEMVRRTRLPVVVVVTRTDLVPATQHARPYLATSGLLPAAIVETAHLESDGEGAAGQAARTTVLDALFAVAPVGDPWYPEEYYTDQEPAFRMAEIIRECAISRLRDEIPHALYVDVADIEERSGHIWARAFLVVERQSQQGIVVGAGGAGVKAIRSCAERALSEIFPSRVKLSIQVKTRARWRHDRATLDRLIR